MSDDFSVNKSIHAGWKKSTLGKLHRLHGLPEVI
jgi:hypothetical protein